MAGGQPISLANLHQVRALCNEHGMDPISFGATTIGAVGPVTFVYGKYTTVVGSALRVSVLDASTHVALDGVTTLLQVDAALTDALHARGSELEQAIELGRPRIDLEDPTVRGERERGGVRELAGVEHAGRGHDMLAFLRRN